MGEGELSRPVDPGHVDSSVSGHVTTWRLLPLPETPFSGAQKQFRSEVHVFLCSTFPWPAAPATVRTYETFLRSARAAYRCQLEQANGWSPQYLASHIVASGAVVLREDC